MLRFLDEIDHPIFKVWRSEQRKHINSLHYYLLAFRKYILGNKFISDTTRKELYELLDAVAYKANLSYKYTKIWFINCIKKKPAVNNLDLELNSIREDTKDVIVYLDMVNRRKYLFSQKDFKKIIKTRLENSYVYDHVPEPLIITNPYTNREIGRLELMAIDEMLIDAPLIWRLYRDCYYDIERFRIINHTFLLNVSVFSYVDQLEDIDIVFYIHDILSCYEIEYYCNDCVEKHIGFDNKELKGIIIQWLLAKKLLGIFNRFNAIKLYKMFSIPCKNKVVKPAIVFNSNTIDIEFTGGPLKENYIFKATMSLETAFKRYKFPSRINNRNVFKRKKVIKAIR
jgi:hypothetical protein